VSVGLGSRVLESRVQPEIVVVWTEDDRDPIVNVRREAIWLGLIVADYVSGSGRHLLGLTWQ
jgi:hypothetical protein